MIENRNLRSICHASVGTSQLSQATEFYTKILKTLGIALVSTYEHASAFGKEYPEFWVQLPFNKQKMTVGNGVHFGFVATSKAQVNLFYKTALECGGVCNGKPGARPEYGEPYYGCFVKDLDGNCIEASYWHQESS